MTKCQFDDCIWRITGNTDNCLIMPDYCLKTTAGSSKLFSQCLLYERQTLWDSSAFNKSKTLLSHHFGSRTILSCTECTWWWMCIHGSRHACMPACFPSTYCQLWSFEFRSSQLSVVFCQIIEKMLPINPKHEDVLSLTYSVCAILHVHIQLPYAKPTFKAANWLSGWQIVRTSMHECKTAKELNP